MTNNASDIIFFIGAGFSKPAGVPTMPEFVQIFEDERQEVWGQILTLGERTEMSVWLVRGG